MVKRELTLKSSWMNRPCSFVRQHVRLEQEPARRTGDVSRQQRRQPGAAGVVHGIVGVVSAEGEGAAGVGIREGRRIPIDEPVAELQTVASLQPHERILNLPVELLRVDREEMLDHRRCRSCRAR